MHLSRTLTVLALVAALAPFAQASELQKKQGVSILVLDGTPKARGRAHGKLLAEEILGNAAALYKMRQNKMPDDKVWTSTLGKFVWTQSDSDELDGIVEGVREKLGADVKVPGTERTFDRRDLEGLNCLADLLPLACSSFTVAGARVEGGGTITARNLDYPVLENMIPQRLVIVRAAIDGHHAWATISWPGLIGCYTGMSDAGVTASIHDVPTNPAFLLQKGFTPRSMGLRRILEKTEADGFAEKAAKVLRGLRVAYGNNIHVSAPGGGVILEWDPDRKNEEGVTIREAKDGAVICTNHWRSRREPEKCPRFDALVKALADRKEPWTPRSAMKALRVSNVKGMVVTMHSAVFALESRTLLVAFAADGEHPAAKEQSVEIDLGALFARSGKRWY